jgi:CRP-like cAMP-binding protein
MAESPARKLKDQLDAAMAKDRLKEAAELLVKLERAELDEPKWSHRAGDLFRRLGRNAEAIQAYERAVERYAKGGFLARAVAMAKTITSIDPSRTDVLARIQQDGAKDVTEKARRHVQGLHGVRTAAVERAAQAQPVVKSVAEPPPRPASLPVAPVAPAVIAAPAPDPFGEPQPTRPSLRPPVGRGSFIDDLADDDEDEGRPTFVAIQVPRAAAPARESVVMELPAEELEIMYVEDDAAVATDDTETRTAERLAVMPLFALFAEVPREALLAMATDSDLIELEADQQVLRAGDAADALFAIVAGAVRVVLPDASDDEMIVLGEGEVFGEACLLTDEPRHADVYAAEGGVSALRIPKATLDALVEQHDAVGRLLTQLLAHRLITNLMRTSALFTALEPETRREVVALFELRRAPHGTVLLEGGRRGDGLYVPLTGQLHVTDRSGQASVLPAGSVIGSSSLLSQGAYPNTVLTLGDMLLLRLPAAQFMSLVTQYPTVLERLTELGAQTEN